MREDTKKKFDQMNALLAKGMTVVDASKELGIHNTTYYGWKKALGDAKTSKKKYTKKPAFLSIPLETKSLPLVILMGSSADVNSALDRLSKMGAQ